MKTFVIIHNLVVEERRDTHESGFFDLQDDINLVNEPGEQSFNWSSATVLMNEYEFLSNSLASQLW